MYIKNKYNIGMKLKLESDNEFKINIIDSSSHITEEVKVVYNNDKKIDIRLEDNSKIKVSLDNLHKKK